MWIHYQCSLFWAKTTVNDKPTQAQETVPFCPGGGLVYQLHQQGEKRLTWRVFEDERAEFVSGVKHAAVSTGLTGIANGLFLRVDMLEKPKKHNLVELKAATTSSDVSITLASSLEPRFRRWKIFTRSVSGLSHSGHSTNFLMNPSSMSCNLFASWDPLTM